MLKQSGKVGNPTSEVSVEDSLILLSKALIGTLTLIMLYEIFTLV
jgi:hypothetical protein